MNISWAAILQGVFMGFVFPIGFAWLGAWLPRDAYQQKYPHRSYWGMIIVQAVVIGIIFGIVTVGVNYLFDQQWVWREGLFTATGYVVGMLLGSFLVVQRQART